MNKKVSKFLAGILAMAFIFNFTILNSSAIASTTEKKTFKERRLEKKAIKNANKAVKKAKKAMKKKKYDLVQEILEPQLNNDYDSEVKVLYTMVENFKKANVAFNEDNIEAAKEYINGIDESYREYKIASEINEVKNKIELREKNLKAIEEDITRLVTLVEEKSTVQAPALIKSLKEKNLTEYHKNLVNDLEIKVNDLIAEEKRIEAERLAAIEKAKKEQEEKDRLAREAQEREEKRKQELANSKPQTNNQGSSSSSSSSSNNTSSNNSSQSKPQTSNPNSGGQYYVAKGNRYYHKTPSCKFLEGAATTTTNDVSSKFPCNCVKY